MTDIHFMTFTTTFFLFLVPKLFHRIRKLECHKISILSLYSIGTLRNCFFSYHFIPFIAINLLSDIKHHFTTEEQETRKPFLKIMMRNKRVDLSFLYSYSIGDTNFLLRVKINRPS